MEHSGFDASIFGHNNPSPLTTDFSFQSPFSIGGNEQEFSTVLPFHHNDIATFGSEGESLMLPFVESSLFPLENNFVGSDFLVGNLSELHQSATPHTFSPADLLTRAVSEVRSSLEAFLTQPDYIEKLHLAFGTSWQAETATGVIKDIIKGKELPSIEIVAGSTLQSQGAFNQDTNTIYFSEQFLLNNQHNSNALISVVAEELGHFIDTKLHQTDSAGDEGRLFALLLQGIDSTPQEIQKLKAENDFKTVTFDNQTLLVEQSTNDITGTRGRDYIIGTDGNDRITGGFSTDIIIGGSGSDTFVYDNVRDAGDTIKDFELRTDVIDVTGVLNSFGYNGVNPIGDGYIQFRSSATGTTLLLDSDGAGRLGARPYLTVENVTPDELRSFPGHFLPGQVIQLPEVTAALANDTGVSDSDGITLDPTIAGQTTDATSLQGNLNGNGFVDISDALSEDGSFTISLEQYEVLSNGSLPSGEYILELKAGNSAGQESAITTVNFTLDRTAPPLSFTLAPESDTGEIGDNSTTEYTVKLIGQTDPGLEVLLVETQQKVTADENGTFTFTDVVMPSAGKAPFTMVVQDEAGNQGRAQQFLTREGINGAPEITSTPELVFDTENQDTYTYTIEATDPDGDNLAYTLIDAPFEAEVDENGLLNFTPAENVAPFYDFTVQVDDGRGGTDTQTFTVEVPAFANLGTIKGIKWEDLNRNGVRDDNNTLSEEIELVDNFTQGYYNSAIGDLYPGNPSDPLASYFTGANISTGRPTADFSIAPDLSSINELGTWLSDPESAIQNGFWSDLQSIPARWSVNTETAIIYEVDGGEYGVKNVIADFVVDNSILVWVNGEYQFGIGNPPRFRADDVPLGDLNPGKNYIQIIRADYGIRTNYSVNITGNPIETIAEPGLAGVSVYLDSNNNGVLDEGEPVQLTAEDDLSTPDVDETGQYEFNNLEAGTYIVREIVPDGFEQTFPLRDVTQPGDGYADVILEFVSGGNAPSPLVEPYGSTGGIPAPSPFNNNGQYTVETVNPEVVLGAPPPSPIIGTNPEVDWLALPQGSYVTVGFTDETVIDGSGDDIFIRSFDPQDSANEFADVFVSSNGVDFEFLGTVNERGLVSLDLADINFTEPVTAVRVQGLDNRGSSPGFDLIGVEVLPGSIASPDFYTIELSEGEVVEDINFGNAQIAINQDPIILSSPVIEAVAGQSYTYELRASDPDGDALTFSFNQAPEGMIIDANTGQITYTPPVAEIGNDLTVEVLVSDGNGGEIVQTYTLSVVETSANQAPLITSTPETNITIGETYEYQVEVTDPDNDALTFTLLEFPDGLEIDSSGKITWNPTEIGEFLLEIEVSDGRGGIDRQRYDINVLFDSSLDTEAPQVNLGFNNTVFSLSDTLDLQIQGVDNVGLADLDLAFNGNSLSLSPDTIANGFINSASVTLNTVGVFEVVATATDLAGNTDTETISVRVLDPNDTQAPTVALDLSGFDPLNPLIDEKTNIIGTVNDENLEFYRVDIAPVSLINLSNPAANDPDYITIAQGTGNVNNGVLAQIDPNLYRNDEYYVRVYTQDVNGNINVEGLVTGISSQNKPGEFSLDFTDVSVPVTGIPIEITRRYSSLDANFQGDFGYGWELGLQDAQIVESAQNGTDLGFDSFFGGNSFTVGTRVTLTTPDGRRVGFTFDPVIDGGGFLGARYAPRFVPDPGVYETLEVPYTPLSLNSDGTVGLFLFNFTYNPSDYILTTKDGTKYNYDQNQGLQTVEDRNGNILTFADDGITSSTGVEIDFIRDAQGRITEIVDPEGESILYDYDADGDLVGVTDREENQTTFLYEGERPHYLTEIIDPLGRTGVRTQYDENGQISGIFDADGNALDINYDSASSRQTVKDPFGNSTTFVFDERGNVISEIDALGGVTARTYDANYNITSETDPEGNTISSTYDSRGNKLTETDGEGNTTTFTYNANNDILTETDALGNTTTNVYDINGNLTSRTDAEGNVTTYEYGQFGLLTEVVDANGNRSNFAYDFFGNVTELEDPTGAKTSFTYDGNGRVTTVTDPLGNITEYTYDAQGRVTVKEDPEGNACGCGNGGVTRTEYNAAGEKVAEIDALGRRTEYRYNERGLLIETIYPDATPEDLSDNPRITNKYDALDRLIASTDEDGRKTSFVFDELGRQTQTIFADSTPENISDNPRTTTEYDGAGRVIAEIDELGNRTEFEYDGAGNTILQRDALDNETEFIYDEVGRQVAIVDAFNRRTDFIYDELGQLTTTTFADGTTSSTTYDALGNIIIETDRNGNITQFEYDALSRLTAVVDALDQRTEYGRDVRGNILTQIDANGNINQFTYDSLNRRTSMNLPLGQDSNTTYDAVGNIVSTTDFNRENITYEYDERNRLIATNLPDGEIERFTYTGTGQIATITDERGITTFTYDERDRLLSRTEPDGRSISYTYDDAGNILTLTVPSGTTTYSYDALNRTVTVTDPDEGETTYVYDAVGNIVETAFANGVIETRDYDDLNRLIFLENSNSDGVLSSYNYTLDNVGNRTQIVENNGNVAEYQYDNLYRLTQETINNPVEGNRTIEYNFDAVGNRIETVDSILGTTTYIYDANDRLLSETLNGDVTEYTYDDNGNRTSLIRNGTVEATYEWNAKGELTAIQATENGETGRVEYQYDTDGVRVAININGEETRFLIDKNQQQFAQIIEEYITTESTISSYVHGVDLISKNDVDGRIFYQVDGLGSTRVLTDIDNNVVQEYSYDAYGNLTQQVGSVNNNYLFAGEQFDNNFDGYYLRARYYNPSTGRFASRDPFEGFNNQPVTLHDYLYAANNPVINIDPSGEVTLFGYTITTKKLIGASGVGLTALGYLFSSPLVQIACSLLAKNPLVTITIGTDGVSELRQLDFFQTTSASLLGATFNFPKRQLPPNTKPFPITLANGLGLLECDYIYLD